MKDAEEPLLDTLFSPPSASCSSEEARPVPFKHQSYELDEPIGSTCTIRLRLLNKHALWGDHLWNGARWTADYLTGRITVPQPLALDAHSHPLDVKACIKGKSVLEMGAGAGLPSLLCGLMGARLVVATDYPDDDLVDNLQHNLDSHGSHGSGSALTEAKMLARGFLWGSDTGGLLALNDGRPFDIIILADVVFNHSEHEKLVRSCAELLAPRTGTIICAFTHYRPWLAEKDLHFLEHARMAGFTVEKVDEAKYELMFLHDRGDAETRRTVHAYFLSLSSKP